MIERCMELNDRDRIQDSTELLKSLSEINGSAPDANTPGLRSIDISTSNIGESRRDSENDDAHAKPRHPTHGGLRYPSGIRDTQRLSYILKIALLVNFCLVALGLWSTMLEIALIERIANGSTVSQLDIASNDARQQIIGQIQFTVYVVCAIFFLQWTYFLARNARNLGGSSLNISPGWAVGWYFVPFASLWKPYQAIKNISRVLRSDISLDIRQAKRPLILPIWWAFWVAHTYIFSPKGKDLIVLLIGSPTASEILDISRRELVSLLFELPATLTCLILVNVLQKMQHKKTVSIDQDH